MSLLSKSAMAGVAALTVVSGLAATSAPAAAWYQGGWGAPVAAGVIGGLAAGAIIGSATHPYGYYPAPEPAYAPCYRARRPIYDGYGNFAGYRLVRVCN